MEKGRAQRYSAGGGAPAVRRTQLWVGSPLSCEVEAPPALLQRPAKLSSQVGRRGGWAPPAASGAAETTHSPGEHVQQPLTHQGNMSITRRRGARCARRGSEGSEVLISHCRIAMATRCACSLWVPHS